jgi:L-amino acid N-acyltransferase YncA
MALARRENTEALKPPSPHRPRVVAVAAERWLRSTAQTWPPLTSAAKPRPVGGRSWIPRPADIEILTMRADHAEHVLAIYQAALDTDTASFETCAPSWARFDAAHLADHRFVACDRRTGAVLGWVALTAVSNRAAYAGVAEESIYVHPGVRGVGIGSMLLAAAIASSIAAGIWTLQAGVFPENRASLALHRSNGFRIVGVRERIARHRGRWRNMLLLERHDDRPCDGETIAAEGHPLLQAVSRAPWAGWSWEGVLSAQANTALLAVDKMSAAGQGMDEPTAALFIQVREDLSALIDRLERVRLPESAVQRKV